MGETAVARRRRAGLLGSATRRPCWNRDCCWVAEMLEVGEVAERLAIGEREEHESVVDGEEEETVWFSSPT